MKMQEQFQSETASWIAALLYKFLPAGLGAAIAILVDPPKTKRDIFTRFFAAFVCSAMLGDVVFAALKANVGWLSFLDPTKRAHTSAVDFIMGAVGWFIVGGAVMWLKKFRAEPVAAVEEAKKALP